MTHLETLRRLLPSQYRDKELGQLDALLEIFAEELQAADDALVAIPASLDLDVAADTTLDMRGRLVGQDRGGMPDALYRRFIRARVRANRSSGTRKDLGDVTRIVLQDLAPVVTILEGGMEAVLRVLNVAVPDDAADAAIQFLRIARPATVRVLLHTSVAAPADTFELDGDVGQGFLDGSPATLDTGDELSFSMNVTWLAPGTRYNGYTLRLFADAAESLVIDHTARSVTYYFVDGVTKRTDFRSALSSTGFFSVGVVASGSTPLTDLDEGSALVFVGGTDSSGGRLSRTQE